MLIYLKLIHMKQSTRHKINCNWGYKLCLSTTEAPMQHFPGLAILRSEISSSWYVLNKTIVSNALSLLQSKVSY